MKVQGLGYPVTPYCCNTSTFKGASGSQPPLLQPQQSPSLTTVQTFASQTIDPDSPEVEFTRRGIFQVKGTYKVSSTGSSREGVTLLFFLYNMQMFSSLVWFLLISHQGMPKYSSRPVQPYHNRRCPPFCPNNCGNNCTGHLKLKIKDFWSNSHKHSHRH